eukprot:GFUD01031737.1.p1 GENE.GFUD01031737.1~~GFUD01031737.1.p1  ORF type:complete len:274 (+),score=69.56 GFUD01031737.1:52-873(+)
MALLNRISRCLESASDIPTDVRFLFTREEGATIKEVKAHKMILGIASDVFERQFFGALGEPKDDIDIIDVSAEVFTVMVEYIYNKKLDWMDYNLGFLSSLYYAAEKFNIEELREEIIASIPEHEVSEENLLDVAILAEDNLHHQPLSDTLYEVAASFLKNKFDSKIENVYKFFSETEASEVDGLVLVKMMARMMSLPDPMCENCKKTACLDGQVLTRENFVPGATVLMNGQKSKLVEVDVDLGDGRSVQNRFIFLNIHKSVGYYHQCYSFKCI